MSDQPDSNPSLPRLSIPADGSAARFAAAIHEVLLATSSDGRVAGPPAGRLRAASRSLSASQRLSVYWELLSEYAHWSPSSFGEALPVGIAQETALRESIHVAAVEPGALRTRILRFGMSLRETCRSAGARAKPLSPLGEVGDAIGHGIRAAAVRGLESAKARAFVHLAAHDARPHLAALLEEVGLDIRHLAACFALAIPQPASLESFWAAASPGPVVGSVIGLDFIHTASGWTLIESNLSVGRRGIRLSLTTPPSLPERLVAYTAAQSRGHLVVMNNDDRLEPEIFEAYAHAGEVHGVDVQVYEEPATVGSPFPGSFRIPRALPTDALVASIRAHPTTIPFLVSDKLASHLILSQQGDSPDYATVPLLWDPGSALATHDRFPNVICKLPGLDATKGIALLKVKSLADIPHLLQAGFERGALKAHVVGALERLAANPAAIAQPYLPSQLADDDCLSLVRTYVLVTPDDAAYLGGNVAWSADPVPKSLPWGLVEDKRPFVVNGGIPRTRLTGIPEEWEAALQRATIAVGHAFRHHLLSHVAWRPRTAA